MHNFKRKPIQEESGREEPNNDELNDSNAPHSKPVFEKKALSEEKVEEAALVTENQMSLEKKSRLRRFVRAHQILTVFLLIFGYFFIKGWVGAIMAGQPFSAKQIFLSAFSQEVDMDDQEHTNILLIGTGDVTHEAADLTDTIMVASIDHENHTVSMLSIPRDLFMPDQEDLGYGVKINAIYALVKDETGSSQKGIDSLERTLEDLLGIEIHYYMKIDFNVLVDVVDALGGIDVYVENEIYDPSYPSYIAGEFDPFYIESGLQHMDGETALKYARSRETTSDFDRALRQQAIILAIQEQALNLGVLLSPSKLTDLYEAVSKNVETDLEMSELIYLAKISDQFGASQVNSAVLSSNPFSMGGFLYEPDNSLYEVGYIVMPSAGDNSELQEFAELYFYHQSLYVNDTPIEILNGTNIEGLSGSATDYLIRYGINVVDFGDALERDTENQIFTNKVLQDEEMGVPEDLNLLIPNLESLDEPPSGYDRSEYESEAKYIIILGDDFAKFYKNHENLFYGYY